MTEITPAFKVNNVPIIFASDDYFVPYMAVMIQSIQCHAHSGNNYDILVLHRGISAENQRLLHNMLKDYVNFSIRFIDVAAYLTGYTLYIENRAFFAIEAYFRLLAPFLLLNYNKAIYFDGDMVALTDVAALLQVDLADNLVAAVRDFCGIADAYSDPLVRKEYMEKVVKMDDVSNYYISGLLVLNFVEFRRLYTMRQVMETSASYPWRYHDQDVLNYFTRGRTLLLDSRWNVVQDYGLHKSMPAELYQEWKKSTKSPFIVHFGGDAKPWRFCRVPNGRKFWRYAKLTPYYEIIKQRRGEMLASNSVVRLKYYIQIFCPLGSKSRRILKKYTKPIWERLMLGISKNS